MKRIFDFEILLKLIMIVGVWLLIFILEPAYIRAHLSQDKVESEKAILKKYKSFRLENRVLIDTTDEKLLKKGLFDITDFVIDSEGNIYLLNDKSDKDIIFKFDRQGKFIMSFGRKGQGPGEIERPYKMHIVKDEEILVHDPVRAKIVLFGKDGNIINELKVPVGINNIYPLPNGRYVGEESIVDPRAKEFGHTLNYYDGEFNKLEQLDMLSYPNPFQSSKIEAYFRRIIYTVSSEKIYSGYPERGYEILSFNLNGDLIKKISMKKRKISDIEEYKKIFLEYFGMLPKKIKDRLVFPKYPPFFHSFIADEFGYLFVMTYEPGKKEREYMYDIISPQGVLINRVSLGINFDQSTIFAIIREDNLFWIRQSESGKKELIVSRIY